MFNRLFIEPGGTKLDDETVIHFTVHCACSTIAEHGGINGAAQGGEFDLHR